MNTPEDDFVQNLAHYTVFDSEGRVVRSGSCRPDLVELQAQEGETVVEGLHEDLEEQPKPLYSHTVARAYPAIGDQLDTIWKLLADKPDLLNKDAKEMIGKISQTKADYPKDQRYVKLEDGTFAPSE